MPEIFVTFGLKCNRVKVFEVAEVRGKPFLTKNKIEKGQRYEEHGVCGRAVIH